MSHHLMDNLKVNMISYFKTGNLIVDCISSMLIICLMTMVTGRILKIFEFFEMPNFEDLKHYFIKPTSISIRGSKLIETKWFNTRFDFSLRFQAILYQISLSINSGNNEIKELSEMQVREDVKFHEGKKDVSVDFSYIVKQENPFLLDNDIYCQVKRLFEDNDKKQKVIRESYEIKVFSYGKSLFKLEKYLEEITNEYEKEQTRKREGKQYILTFDGFNEESGGIKWEVNDFETNRSFENIFFEGKDEIVKMIKDFEEQKDFYREIGKPYHLGILLYGEPGCGKTSFINALCHELRRSIKEIDFNKIRSINDLNKAINCCSYKNINMGYDKSVLVFEDIDCATEILKSRKNKKEEIKIENIKLEDLLKLKENKEELTLANILNLIDGSKEMPGRIMIFTSNYPEELDEALVRPGRIDIKINFKSCSSEMVKEMIDHYYQKYENYFRKRIDINWEENKVEDYKWKPCEIVNMLQRYGHNEKLLMCHLI